MKKKITALVEHIADNYVVIRLMPGTRKQRTELNEIYNKKLCLSACFGHGSRILGDGNPDWVTVCIRKEP